MIDYKNYSDTQIEKLRQMAADVGAAPNGDFWEGATEEEMVAATQDSIERLFVALRVVPPSYTETATCLNCGVVPVPHEWAQVSNKVLAGCPWCLPAKGASSDVRA